MNDKTIYFITTRFPPMGRGPSMVRGYQCLSLLQEGWTVCVITMSSKEMAETSLLEELQSFNSFHIKTFNASAGVFHNICQVFERLGFCLDARYQWINNVKKNLSLSNNKNSIVFATTGGDVGALEVGLFMKEKWGLPLVLNFRDPIDNTIFNGKKLDWWAATRESLERKYVERADHIVTATDTMKKELQSKHQIDDDKVDTVYGGYVKENVDKKKGMKDVLNIGYAGGVTRHQKPEILVKALSLLPEEILKKVKVHFWGHKNISRRIDVADRLSGNIVTHDFVARDQFICDFQQKVDVAFLSLSGDYFEYALPSKIFEYINAEKPILASGPSGAMEQFIKKEAIGIFVNYKEKEALSHQISLLATHPEILEGFKNNIKVIKPRFLTEKQTCKLSALFQQLLESN